MIFFSGSPLNRELKNCLLYAKACSKAALETGAKFLNLFDAMIAQQVSPSTYFSALFIVPLTVSTLPPLIYYPQH